MQSPVFISQILISFDADTIKDPLGLYDADVTADLCPLNDLIESPLSTLHSLIYPSSDVVSIFFPSGLKVAERI